jgi:hypothetical protein
MCLYDGGSIFAFWPERGWKGFLRYLSGKENYCANPFSLLLRTEGNNYIVYYFAKLAPGAMK